MKMLKFGEKFAKVWPEENPHILTEFGKKLIGECAKIEKKSIGDTTIADIIKASSNFPIEFGTNTCRIQNQPETRHTLIINQLTSAYPVIHERVLFLYMQFLEHKCQYDTRPAWISNFTEGGDVNKQNFYRVSNGIIRMC